MCRRPWYAEFCPVNKKFSDNNNNNNLRLIGYEFDKPLNLTHDIQHITVCHAGQQ